MKEINKVETIVASNLLRTEKQYWLEKLPSEVVKTILPFQSSEKHKLDKEMDVANFSIDDELCMKIIKLCKNSDQRLFMVLYSVLSVLLHRYTMNENIIVEVPINKQETDTKYINTRLPLIQKVSSDTTYKEFLLQIKDTMQDAYDNANYPINKIYEMLDKEYPDEESPLTDIAVIVENIHETRYIDEIKCNIKLFFLRKDSGITMRIEYNSSLYKIYYIKQIYEHIVNILKQVLGNPNTRISEIDMLSQEEKHQLLYKFNDTYADYQSDKTIHELFEEQVKKTPDSIALIYEDKKLTYRELNERANRLARTLKESGVKPESIVAVMVERSVEMIVSIIAILKSGGAYLPVDPEYPQERIQYMLQDSKAGVLLTQKSLLGTEFSGKVIDVEDEQMYALDHGSLENISTPGNLAYVIYTSGSTGRPKGVMLEHKGIASLQAFFKEDLKVNEKDRVLQFASSSFDASVWESFMALLTGARLYVVSKEVINDFNKMKTYLKGNKITIATLPPSYLANLDIEGDLSLRQLITAGSATNHELVNRWKNRLEYINAYGPTETTICATIYRCNGEEDRFRNIPIGSAIKNTKVYILNMHQNCQPVGVIGEIYISGDGVARGYLGKPDLTAETFLRNPYEPGQRMYKTGDLGRWLPDGNIEFLGRMDHQVKIRGFRIELGEIERWLMELEGIKETVVIDREEEGNTHLYAYYVSERNYSIDELREALKRSLPDYMIPSYFISLDKMPLTQNGKIDRKTLSKLEEEIDAGAVYEAPRNEIERKLVEIWVEILGVSKIGINDNFFNLGGHSIRATILGAQIHKELNVEIPLGEIFTLGTIKGLSEYIALNEKSTYEEIEKVEEREYYEASSAQKRMYMLQELDGEGKAYNIPGAIVIEGKLEVEKVEETFKKLIARHESLRTSFEAKEEGIIQKVHQTVDFSVEYEEAKDQEDAENRVQSFIKPFNLGKAPLLRVKLIKTDTDKHIMVFDIHHIISDGVSMGILTKEFVQIYEGSDLGELRIQYKDFSAWQNKLLHSEDIKNQEKYWLDKFQGEIPVLNMPTDYERPEVQNFEGDVIGFHLEESLTQGVRKLAEKTGTSLFMVLLSVYNVLLAKYTAQEDIIVGTSIAGRPHADLQNIIGMFVNTLPMRNYPIGNKRFIDFLEEVKENSLKVYENQDYQFEELVDKLNVRRDVSRNPLFDTVFELQNMDTGDFEISTLKMKSYESRNKISKFDILMAASETADRIEIGLEYCTKLFKRETMERLAEHFTNIIKEIVLNPTSKLSEIDMLGEEEKHKLIYELNNNKVDFDTNKTVCKLIEEKADIFPERIALEYGEEKIAYKYLNERANQIARFLMNIGLREEQTVGIMMERCPLMVESILGTWKAGGAYIPIDASYPAERVKEILKDSKTKIVITESKHVHPELEEQYEGVIIKADIDAEKIDNEDKGNLNIKISSSNLAYVIYTSGSTGKPKGAMVEHVGMTNHMLAKIKELQISEESIIVQNASHCFDISVWQFFGAMCCGGKTVIYNNDTAMNSQELVNKIKNDKVTILEVVPSLLSVMLDYPDQNKEKFKTLKYIVVTGEVLKANLVKKWFEIYPEIKMVNAYGPTEASDDITHFVMEQYPDTINIPIGKPVQNFNIYIIDKDVHLCPLGVKGEIVVSGIGVGRGYLNDEEKTQKAFMEDPFVEEHARRLYRTGDLGRWLTDGTMEFFGRKDHQVKIRGYRIELQEIEKKLAECKNLKESTVMDLEDGNGNKYLCAYVVSENPINIKEIKAELRKYLPDYMVPSYFMQIERLPLTPNGKVDRKALPKPEGEVIAGVEYEGPQNVIEENLVIMWKEVLGVNNIGITDNFFDLGGHSLKATVLRGKIHKEFNVEIPLREIFVLGTIKGLSAYITEKEKSIFEEISTIEEKEYYEASSAQKRMYMIQAFDKESIAYNIPDAVEIKGKLDAERVRESFIKLIERHETLRTSFETKGELIIQRIHRMQDINFDMESISVTAETEVKEKINSFVKAFDLSRAPLLRVGIIKLEEERHVLLFDMHHIISDGVSMDIITKEFEELYSGKKLKPMRIQYKDFSEWQNRLIKLGKMKKEQEYWLNKFKGDIPVLDMPTDYERPAVKSFDGDSIDFTVDRKLTDKLKEISKDTGTTLYMILLSAYNILLSKYTGQEDIIVGSPIAGRPHADLENIIGMFLNTLAMRNYPKGEKTFEEFLIEVKENALEAYENQHYQFEELVDRLNLKRDRSRNPIFDTMFVLQNTGNGQETAISDLRFAPYNIENRTAKFDILLDSVEVEGGIYFRLEYCTRLFKNETVRKIAEDYIKILEQITKQREVKIKDIDLMDQDEKDKIRSKIKQAMKKMESQFGSFD